MMMMTGRPVMMIIIKLRRHRAHRVVINLVVAASAVE